eukprot:6952032-Prorocentrum_lima.AAC.1
MDAVDPGRNIIDWPGNIGRSIMAITILAFLFPVLSVMKCKNVWRRMARSLLCKAIGVYQRTRPRK